MSTFRAYSKAKYFDMRDIQTPVRDTGVYCLSGVTWQLLKGWLDFYGDWRSRYVVDLEVPIYQLQAVDDDDWQIVQDALDLAQHEIGDDMSCDIVGAINSLTLAIQSQSGCCSGSYGSTQNPPGTIDGSEETPPAGFVDPVVAIDTHRCDMSNLFYHGVDNLLTGLINVGFENQFTLGMTIITLTFTGVLASVSAFFAAFVDYIGFIANLILALWSGDFSLATMQSEWQANKSDIVCTLYSNGSSDARKIAYDELIDTFDLSDAEAGFLKSFATLSTLAAQFYAPETLADQWAELVGEMDSTYYDCAGCSGASGWTVLENQGIVQGDLGDMATAWVEVVGQDPGNGNNQVVLRRTGFVTATGQPCPTEPTVGGPVWVAAAVQSFKNNTVCESGTVAAYNYPTGLPAGLTDDLYSLRMTMNGNIGESFWFTTNETVSQTPPPGTTGQ